MIHTALFLIATTVVVGFGIILIPVVIAALMYGGLGIGGLLLLFVPGMRLVAWVLLFAQLGIWELRHHHA